MSNQKFSAFKFRSCQTGSKAHPQCPLQPEKRLQTCLAQGIYTERLRASIFCSARAGADE